MNRTKINYLTHSWNPIAMRCTPVSEGCAHCWHLAMANRMAGNQMFPPKVRDAYAGKGPPILMKHRLDEPLRCKKPATIGVQFMGDLFHKKVPDTYIRSVFGTIVDCPQHKFLILTKRPDEVLNFLRLNPQLGGRFPDNVWLGVSIKNQAAADERIPLLLQCPAAVRFVSAEPMLGPVDLSPQHVDDTVFAPLGEERFIDCGGCVGTPGSGGRAGGLQPTCPGHEAGGIDWVIVGGESGPGARPMHPEWARSLRDQCQAAGVPFFFKQWGAWAPYNKESHEGKLAIWQDQPGWGLTQRDKIQFLHISGSCDPSYKETSTMIRVGKRAAGRLLDGQTWSEFPKEAQREA